MISNNSEKHFLQHDRRRLCRIERRASLNSLAAMVTCILLLFHLKALLMFLDVLISKCTVFTNFVGELQLQPLDRSTHVFSEFWDYYRMLPFYVASCLSSVIIWRLKQVFSVVISLGSRKNLGVVGSSSDFILI